MHDRSLPCWLLLAATAPRTRRAIRTSRSSWCCPIRRAAIIDYVGRADRAASRRNRSASRWSRRTGPAPAASAGTDTVARSAPDGYTLVHHGPGDRDQSDAAAEHALRSVQAACRPFPSSARRRKCVVVAPQLPVKTVAELDRLRQGQPGQDELRLRRHRHHAASRAPSCSCSARASRRPTCPIAASAQSYPDMMANKIQFAFSSIAGALPFTKDNRVRADRDHRH